MFHNYFFLKRLTKSLDDRLKGLHLLECFSQNKDELVLGFANTDQELYLRADLSSQISLITVNDDFKRAKKNSVDLFSELIDHQVTGVDIFNYERSFAIKFDHGQQLLFKMHGSRSNILLTDEDATVTLFRNNLPNDMGIIPSELHKSLDLSRSRFEELKGNPRKFLPALGKEVNQYLKEQGYEQASIDHQWAIFQSVLHQLETNPIYIYDDGLPVLSLLPLDLEIVLETHDPIAACQRYFEQYSRTYHLESERQKATRPIQSIIKKTENYLKKTYDKLDNIQERRKYDELANIIMANLHQIPKGKKSIELDDFYSDSKVTIKLNPEFTPQKNAENLYRKAKNQQLEVNNLEANLEAREEELVEMKQRLLHIEEAEDIKTIRQLAVKKEKNSQKKANVPYHLFELQNYQIMVGRNARCNDELTLKVAKKDDLWLHAKDVAGSHVVIRHQAGKNFPKPVIEYAAQLAAGFSKRSTDSLCPVIYTPKKFIRKRKGDPAGAVVVEKEEIIMVQPRK